MKVEFNLPGSSFEELKKIIQAYGHFVEKAPLSEVGKLAGVHSTTISKNAKFLVDLSILSDGAQKTATDLGRKLGRAIEHRVEDEISEYFRDAVASNEKLSKLITTLRIKGGMAERAFSDHILYVSGAKATSGNRTGARCVVDVLLAAKLIEEGDGKLCVSIDATPSNDVSEQAETIEVTEKVVQSDYPEVAQAPARGDKTSRNGYQVNINIQIHLPENQDFETYEKIFRAMKENLFEK